ncbi:MAG TPA: adenine deaminase [Deferrisomatales bacterium]|nr:adenine deaminase [Deferrisomatales bacterium]
MELPSLLACARGEVPADLLLTGASLVDVCSGAVRRTDIAVSGAHVAGLGPGYRGREVIDLDGRFVCPGLIDAHVHLESSLVRPREFARAVVPRGVTCVVSNPHEIANVLGAVGIRWMQADAAESPLSVLVTVPSCVPATRLSTSGAELSDADLVSLRDAPLTVGLGEVMDYLGVVAGAEQLLWEIDLFRGLPLDGHAPGLSGPLLQAYVAAGPSSEHECTTLEEAQEKLASGMTIFLREGSAARNLQALLPLVTPAAERRLCFCTDDRQPADLIGEGSVDHLIRCAVASGVPPLLALRLATLNVAEHSRLHDRGAVTPGRRADLVVFRDPANFQAEMVFQGGRLVARGGRLTPRGAADLPGEELDRVVRGTIRIDWDQVSLRIPSGSGPVRVIGTAPGQLLTEEILLEPKTADGEVVADPARDLLKLAVIERHRGSGRAGLGLVRGLGLRRGAIAGTIAHDHHNLVVLGADDVSMHTAARAVAASDGGLAAARGAELLALLPLPLAGLMSDRPIEEVQDGLASLLAAARALGSPLPDPFMALSFLALEVIPGLKLTDLGLVDVTAGKVVPLYTREDPS